MLEMLCITRTEYYDNIDVCHARFPAVLRAQNDQRSVKSSRRALMAKRAFSCGGTFLRDRETPPYLCAPRGSVLAEDQYYNPFEESSSLSEGINAAIDSRKTVGVSKGDCGQIGKWTQNSIEPLV